MGIKIQIKERVFSICIGRKTKWFEQMDLVTITEEFYNTQYEVCYAKSILTWWRK